MFLGDFHMHSSFSDGRLTIPELVDLYGTHGFGAIAITDHLCETTSMIGKAAMHLGRTLTPATFPLYREILRSEAERAWNHYGMIVLPGFELTQNRISNHRSAHIIGIGVSEFINGDADAVDLCRAIRGQGGLSIAAHPVSTRKIEKQTYHLWGRRAELASEFDAWEVASGRHIFDEVMESGLPLIASSDLHRRNQLTSWKTVFNCEKHPAAILEAIRSQNVSFRYFQEAV